MGADSVEFAEARDRAGWFAPKPGDGGGGRAGGVGGTGQHQGRPGCQANVGQVLSPATQPSPRARNQGGLQPLRQAGHQQGRHTQDHDNWAQIAVVLSEGQWGGNQY